MRTRWIRPANQEFTEDQASLDRLAQSDIVGDEQVDPRHAQGLEEWDELVILDLDGAVEGA